MRRIFFIGVLIVFCIIFLLLLSFGLKIGPIKIMSYDDIRNMNINEKILLSELNNKNIVEYKNKENELKEKVSNYSGTKAEYERLLWAGEIKEDSVEKYINIYNFNEIWDSLQNYAKEKSIILDVEIEGNNAIPPLSQNYKNYDLKFSLKGDYINITDFIYCIEDDDSLSFEINKFEISNTSEGLEAKFVVSSVPISVESIKN